MGGRRPWLGACCMGASLDGTACALLRMTGAAMHSQAHAHANFSMPSLVLPCQGGGRVHTSAVT
eukprot:365634-Chlamydomonas_euryale.AAC.3